MDWAKLEEDWQEGDESEELTREDDALQAEMERKKAELEAAGAPDLRRLSRMDPHEARQAVANAQATGQGGPTMMFVDLKTGMGQSGINTEGGERTWLEDDLTWISTQVRVWEWRRVEGFTNVGCC